MSRPFLTAVWSNLCIVSYAVAPEMLRRRLPPGLELDTTLDGRAYVSLVAFDFLNTRVLGVRWPGLVNFPEINLRFYVREPDGRRGVCFVREMVPNRAVSWVARAVYNEPYATGVMSSRVAECDGRIEVEHDARARGGRIRVRAVGRTPAFFPPPDSVEHWFKEHEWGYGVTRGIVGRRRTLRYRVEHPVWAVHAVDSFDLSVDWVGVYGAEWACLASAEPRSVVLAAGSGVTVHPVGG